MNHMKRRDFLKAVSWPAIFGLSGCVSRSSSINDITSMKGNVRIMKLRSHHILDIITSHGMDAEFKPHPYGHSVHIVAKAILSDMDIKTKLVVAADAVCQGCKHLLPNGQCDDVLSQLDPPPSKQAYNDVLDYRLLDYLNINRDTVMTVREYLEIVNSKVPGIERLCTHPKEDEEKRLNNLARGLVKLGIRSEA